MFKKPKKSHTAHVAEHAFLLCKPDAEQHHRHILQIVTDEGFRVTAKRFTVTPEQAEQVVKTFPSVRRCKAVKDRVEDVFSNHKSVFRKESLQDSERRWSKPTEPGLSNSFCGANSIVCNASDGCIGQNANQTESRQTIMEEILRLTNLRGDGGDAVDAGLTKTVDDVERRREGPTYPAPSTVEPLTEEGINAQRGANNSDNRVSGAAVLKNRLIEAMSYQELVQEHVNHIAYGGTCLAMELSCENAVERLLDLVGPENPIDARMHSPLSIRARFGRDLVRNAVHASANLMEAGQCIAAIFGFFSQYATADVRDQKLSAEDIVRAGYITCNDHGETSSSLAIRPYCELVFPQHCSVARGLPMLEATVTVKNANPQAHMSFYTGEDLDGTKNREALGLKGNMTGDREEQNAHDWQQKAKNLENQLAEKQKELAESAKLLRARELDLLLREHELESATQSMLPALRNRAYSLQDSNQTLCCRSFLRDVSTPVDDGSRGNPNGFLRGKRQSTLSDSFHRNHGSPDRQLVSRCVDAGINSQTVNEVLPTIEADNISALLASPVRLRALFLSLEFSSPRGKVFWVDVEGLYARSPAIQMFWIEDHKERFHNYLVRNTTEPLTFDSFAAVIMFLFKQ